MRIIQRFLLLALILFLAACEPPTKTVEPPHPVPTAAPLSLATETLPVPTIEVVTVTPGATVTATPKPTELPAPTATWHFQTGSSIWGTPAVYEGIVFCGSDDGALYALDAMKGSILWKFQTEGIIRSRPAITGDLVTFTSDDGYLYAVKWRSGKQAWRTDIGNFIPREKRLKLGNSPDPTGYDYMQSSPAISNDTIYTGSLDGKVYALSAKSGTIRWTFKTGNKVRATPTLTDGVVYIGSWDEIMYALDATSGKELWQKPVFGEVQSTALVVNNLVVTASRKANIIALDRHTGKKQWDSDYGMNLWVESSPTLAGEYLYIGSSGYQPIIGYQAQTGRVRTYIDTGGWHWSTPAIFEDFLYIGAVSSIGDPKNLGGLFAIKLENGKFVPSQQWTFSITGADTGEGVWIGVAGSPVIVNGVVYFGGLNGILYAIKLKS